MSKASVASELLLRNQIDKVLRRSRAVQRRPADRSSDSQRVAKLLCDQLDALVGEVGPERD